MIHLRAKILISCALLLVLFSTLVVLAATIGSDSAVTRFNAQQTVNNGDRIAGFAGLYGGFALAGASTVGTFDSFFQVSGPVDLNYGTLVLNQDLVLYDNAYFDTIGNIVGQGHALELSPSMTTVPTTSAIQEGCAIYLATQATTNSGKSINTLDWSVGDALLALGVTTGNPDLEIWGWNASSNTLTFKTTFNVNALPVNSVSWHPTQSWLALGTNNNAGAGAELYIYSVNTVTGALILLSSVNYTANVTSIEWHPSGNYLAVGGAAAAAQVAVYPVNGSGVLGTPVNFNAGATPSNNDAVAWDVTGNYLAVGFAVSANPEVRVFRFGTSPSLSLTQITSLMSTTAALSLDWNQTYTSLLAVGFQTPVAAPVQLYNVDVTLGTMTSVAQISTVYSSAQSVHWNFSGSCLAVGTAAPNFNTVQIYTFVPSTYGFVFSNSFGTTNTLTLRWSRTTGSLATGGTSTLFAYRSIFGSLTPNTTDPNGPGASGLGFIWSNLYLVLNSDITLNDSCIIFSGVSGIDGRGHNLTLTPGARLYLSSGSALTMENITIKGVRNNIIGAFDNVSTFSFNNTEWLLDGRYTFTKGRFDIIGDFTLSGSGSTFAYQTQGTSNIYGSGGNLFLDSGTIFSYEPVTSSRTLLQMISSSALLTMNGATLHSTTTGLQLTNGILVVDRTSYVASDGGIASQGISFGNGVSSSNNLNVEILPAATLNVLSGCLVLNDA